MHHSRPTLAEKEQQHQQPAHGERHCGSGRSRSYKPCRTPAAARSHACDAMASVIHTLAEGLLHVGVSCKRPNRAADRRRLCVPVNPKSHWHSTVPMLDDKPFVYCTTHAKT